MTLPIVASLRKEKPAKHFAGSGSGFNLSLHQTRTGKGPRTRAQMDFRMTSEGKS
ncbi:hypothetical protein LCGC14_1133750 [marine sediment metagenome]|uniref:Uncharacterized protein n=1 Tax=marine sediment metagenome TaxID=412755 RepID=A0A0F9M0D3_9ZZZZ